MKATRGATSRCLRDETDVLGGEVLVAGAERKRLSCADGYDHVLSEAP